MPRKTWVIVPAALGMTLSAGIWGTAQEPKDLPPTPPAQQPRGAGEVIGGTVDSVVQGIKRGARTTSETLQEQYQKARASVHNMGVQARVYGRMHWDKDLTGDEIDVVVKDGTAILRGVVKTAREKVKAVELARDTVGIEQVDDQLTIVAASPAETPVGKAKD